MTSRGWSSFKERKVFSNMVEHVVSQVRAVDDDDFSDDDDSLSSEDLQSRTDSEGSAASSFSSIGGTINRLRDIFSLCFQRSHD
jgi:hypothetical protein